MALGVHGVRDGGVIEGGRKVLAQVDIARHVVGRYNTLRFLCQLVMTTTTDNYEIFTGF